jgi:WD40 repeat protein
VTSSANRPGPAERVLLAAGTASYDWPDFPALDEVPDALRTVVGALKDLGFTTVVQSPGYRLDPALASLRTAVRKAAAAAPVVVVYYTGHGADLEHGTYYLVSKRSRPARLAESALAARDLLELFTLRDDHGGTLADQPTVLVILDCCYSGSAGMTMLGEALRGIGNPNTWVIASAGPLEYAQQGVFAKAFCNAVRQPTIGASQQFVSLDTIVQAVNNAPATHAGQEARVFSPAKGFSGIPPFFANPFHRPDVAGLTVAEQHWLSRLRGGPEESTTGFYLTGRTGRLRAGQDLAVWMTDPNPRGLAVVTGSPGTGKSALLALPVLLTQQTWRPALLRGAEPGSLIQQTADRLPSYTPIAAVHARGLNTDQVATLIANALGRATGTASALLEDLDTAQEQVNRVVAVDAIDEAASPATLLTSLLVPLARQADLRVVVGARPHVLSGVVGADLTIDLDMPEYQDPQALTDYVRRLLLATEEPGVTTCYQADTHAAAEVAAEIARRATSAVTSQDERSESFLIGRLLALSVRGRAEPVATTSADWQSDLPASVSEAFDQDLARLGDKEPKARALLASLAWAKGPGLPWENIWVPVAQALAGDSGERDQRQIADEDVRWLLERAGAYVVEDLGAGQRSVYRPFHEMLAAYLRSEPRSPSSGAEPVPADAWEHRGRTEQAITDALLTTTPVYGQTRNWEFAHPYLRTYLAQHAAAAVPERLSVLVHDPGFLPAADPVTLTPLLPITLPGLRDLARAYRRARPLLSDDLHANAAYLNEAACALIGTAASVGGGIRPLYRTHLASAHQDDSLLTLTGHTDQVLSVAFGTGPDGRLLAASGSRDSTVRLWDPATGAPVGEPLTGHTGPVLSLAFGTGPDGRWLLASGSWDSTVRLWDPATGAPVGEPLTGHTDQVLSVAFGTGPDRQLLLASGSRDSTVRLWDPATGALASEPLTGHTGQVLSVAFGTGPDGRWLLASGSWDSTVRLWDPATGAPVGEPLTGHTDAVLSVAFGTGPDRQLLLASGSDDRTVRLWDPATGTPVGGPLTSPSHSDAVRSVAFGTGSDGRWLLASGSDDRTVRLWDPATGAPVGGPLSSPSHSDAVRSVAFGTGSDGRWLLASGSRDKTVRRWDPATGVPVGEPLTGHTDTVLSVAFGTGPDGRLLLASGSNDQTIRLWDAATGALASEQLTGHTGPVLSVAFGTGPDGRWLLASGSRDKTVRLWDPATGAPVGEPLAGHSEAVASVAFGAWPDGRWLLASGSWDSTVRLWDPATGAPVGEPLTGHTEVVASVAFGAWPDGRWLLASGSRDNTVRLWELATLSCIAAIHRRSSVHSVAMANMALAIGDNEGVSVIEFIA